MSSLSQARVIKIEKIDNHPDADRLELTEVDGMTVVMQKGLNRVGDLVYYVPPDVVVDNTQPPFDFLESKRVKTRKIRGIVSYGLILPLTKGGNEGDIVNELLGVENYEDYLERIGNDPNRTPGSPHFPTHTTTPPTGQIKYTDIDALNKYFRLLVDGEEVVIHEKIDGCCSGYVYQNKKLHVSTRKRWIKDDDSHWWKIAKSQQFEKFLFAFENKLLFGEVYGNINILRYNFHKDGNKFAAFDIYDINKGQYLDYDDFLTTIKQISETVYLPFEPDNDQKMINCPQLNLVPELYRGPWLGIEHAKELAEQNSILYDGIKEGIVVRPTKERTDSRLGRVILKLHSDKFLLRKG